MLIRSILVSAALFCAANPAHAQFYKDKTVTLLINYGVGGNADTEARVYQHYLKKYIPGEPTVIIRNAPGAGGATAMNMLGLNIGSQPDGLTVGYFTTSATQSLVDDPVLKVKLYDFIIVAAARGWNMVYARKDIVPGGLKRAADVVKAQKVFMGGYAKGTSHDTRLRMVLEIMGLPYTVVTGFPGTAQINKAMLQNEVNFTGSSLPGYTTQVIPQIINPGIGMALFHYPIMDANWKPAGNPALEKIGMETFDKVYAEAFGKPPSGPKWDAFFLLNDISAKMQRGIFMPKGSPPEAVEAMRAGVAAVAKDPDFISDYKRVTGEEPDLLKASEVEPLFERMRRIDPQMKQILKESIGTE
jgi:tripartite-type tricarboxylate transporter receptor subunit TctC